MHPASGHCWFYAKACISFLSVQALCKSMHYVLFETWMNYVLFVDELVIAPKASWIALTVRAIIRAISNRQGKSGQSPPQSLPKLGDQPDGGRVKKLFLPE